MIHKNAFFNSHLFIPIVLVILIVMGGLLRFYDLNWGAPFYFHPDERNIASSISQVSLSDMNPHFFAYGSLPIYVIFFIGLILNILNPCAEHITSCTVSFELAIVIGRVLSALFSTLLIPLIYLIGKKLVSPTMGIIASCLVTFSTGLIQYAHFMTFELWSTFFSTLLFLATLMFLKTRSKLSFYSLILTSGILISIKVSNAVLLLVPLLCLFIIFLKEKQHHKTFSKPLGKLALRLLFFFVLGGGIFILTNPFTLSAQKDFLSSMQYESSVALGTLSVFYTGEFHNTIPILFHITKVFPFLLNPIALLFAVAGVLFTAFSTVKKRSLPLFFLLVIFCLLFFSQAFFYVKWVRYMVPTLPFIYLMISYLFVYLFDINKKRYALPISYVGLCILILSGFIFSLSYVITVFVEQDTRVAAKDFATQRFSKDADILSEVYDMGIVPFNDHFTNISLFNFYDLDSQGDILQDELYRKLENTDYFILPSQRLYATRIKNQKNFPVGSAFYSSLNGNPRFTKIYESPCSLFCRLIYLGNPIDQYEGTANVFDRPQIMIFKINE